MARPADRDRHRDASAARAAEVASRLDWLREVAAGRAARGVLLRSRASFAWATLGGLNHVVVGSEAGAVPLLVATEGAWALAPVNEAARLADEELSGLPILVREVPWERAAATEGEAARVAGGDVLSEQDLADELVERRSQLIAAEHDRMREIARDIAEVLDRIGSEVRPGVSEAEAAGDLGGELLRRGIRAPVLLAAADDRIERYRHPIPTDARVRRQLMLVVVAERWGLHVASTRIVDLEPPPADLARRVAATGRVLDAMRSATRPGATLDGVLRAARAAYAEAGYADEWRLHHQGGTIGYAPRERIATPGDRSELRAGMAVAWNPSITGTKLEATMLVNPGGAEVLTS